MSTDLPLDDMTAEEKVRLLEEVWKSLCRHPGDVRSPDWHQQVLEQRTRRLASGEATVSSWNPIYSSNDLPGVRQKLR